MDRNTKGGRVAVDLTPMQPGGINGGIKPFILNLLSGLAGRGWQVTCLCRPAAQEELCSVLPDSIALEAVAPIEARLAQRPKITVPTKVLHGGHDGVGPDRQSETHQRYFTGPYQRRVLPRIGHNVPQEAPADFAAAIRDLARENRL